jgi:hypothetical protein
MSSVVRLDTLQRFEDVFELDKSSVLVPTHNTELFDIALFMWSDRLWAWELVVANQNLAGARWYLGMLACAVHCTKKNPSSPQGTT